jgi:geranylgeranyl pyrophosphate synthase
MLAWLPHYQDQIHSALHTLFTTRYTSNTEVEKLYEEAIAYAVEGGGKRLRPILTLISYEQVSGLPASREVMDIALGIECIHCFTLVHDDLPCMDNDELRRGKPTVWKKYGETMAVLIGDTLQTLGFELIAQSGHAAVVREIAHAIGDMGVTRGQVRDTLLRHDTLTLPELLRIHDEKTGWFIASALVSGALAAGAASDKVESFRSFGFFLGRAFQIKDDILDYESDSETLGKWAGKDVDLGKWIVALIGIEKSREMLAQLESDMLTLIHEFDDPRFADIVEYVVRRTK